MMRYGRLCGVLCAINRMRTAHDSIELHGTFYFSSAMALRLMPRSPRRRIRLVTVADGLAADRKPGRVRKTSASLTPATGARTTRLYRTQPHRSSCALHDRSRETRPATAIAPDAVASTAPHPNVRDDGQRPSSRNGMARADRTDLPDGESGIFFAMGVDEFLVICPSGTNSSS